MDRNTNIALVLCFAILVSFWWFNKPSEEQRAQWQRYYDSLAQFEKQRADSLAQIRELAAAQADTVGLSDSAKVASLSQKFGLIAPAVEGTAANEVLENEFIKVNLSSQGAKIVNVQVKDYTNYNGEPLMMYGDEQSNKFGFVFVHANRSYNTNDLFFQSSGVKTVNDTVQTITYSLPIGDGILAYSYTLTKGNYEVSFAIEADGLGDKITTPHSNIDLIWNAVMPRQEKSIKSEGMWSNVCYRYSAGDVEEMSQTSSDDENIDMSLDWVAYKNQFFSSIFQAKSGFAGASISSHPAAESDTAAIKNVASTLGVKFDFRTKDKAEFRFLFLPNYFYTLKSYEGMELTKLLPLSWGIFRWINEWCIIPLFLYLEKVFSNYGLIILILTLIIKTTIFPLTFSSFKSQAKMRVLKPQIDEINKKIPAEKAMERQQATMALYRKAGINPMSGCLPMLLQMPILFAAFRFFPAAIELRGESFAWASDLSTYDSILDLPFTIPFYGDHVSLFCLLLCITQVVYTKFTMQAQNSASMPGMSVMLYLMPVMMLFFFNDYPAGLCYYYFVSMLITVLQTTIIKSFFIDEKAILERIQSNQKKPVKKGRFAMWYERKMKELEKQQRAQKR
ncbi:MAG: membrane protein insertase YidC [Bacteroidales bacterium]|nr:membrane protein insertase YidC [Bacteroidales bacterium]